MEPCDHRYSRRGLLKLAAASSAAALVGPERILAQAASAAPPRAIDYAAAQRALGAHKIARFAFRRISDRFGRAIGPNAKGGHGGQTGGSSKAAIITRLTSSNRRFIFLPPFLNRKRFNSMT